MVVSRLNLAGGMLILGLLLGGAQVDQVWAAAPPARSGPGSSETKNIAPGLSAEQFARLRSLIKPKPGGFDDLPWMTDLYLARKKAAAEGKPLLVWVGDGHPLGWT